QQTPLSHRGVYSHSCKADDGADGVFEHDSPGELYSGMGSEATLAELAASIAVGNNAKYVSPAESAQYSERHLSRDFHHFVNAPPIRYKPSKISIQLISRPAVAHRREKKDPLPSSSTILHMPPFLPPNSPNTDTICNYHNNYAGIRRLKGSKTSASQGTFSENKLAGFSNHSFSSNGSAAVNIINTLDDSTGLALL